MPVGIGYGPNADLVEKVRSGEGGATPFPVPQQQAQPQRQPLPRTPPPLPQPNVDPRQMIRHNPTEDPETIEQRKDVFKQIFSNPAVLAAMTEVGRSLMRPLPPGVPNDLATRLSEGLPNAMAAIQAELQGQHERAQELREQQRADKQLSLEERRVAASEERSAAAAESSRTQADLTRAQIAMMPTNKRIAETRLKTRQQELELAKAELEDLPAARAAQRQQLEVEKTRSEVQLEIAKLERDALKDEGGVKDMPARLREIYDVAESIQAVGQENGRDISLDRAKLMAATMGKGGADSDTQLQVYKTLLDTLPNLGADPSEVATQVKPLLDQLDLNRSQGDTVLNLLSETGAGGGSSTGRGQVGATSNQRFWSQELNDYVTESEITAEMEASGDTRDQVIKRFKIQTGN